MLATLNLYEATSSAITGVNDRAIVATFYGTGISGQIQALLRR